MNKDWTHKFLKDPINRGIMHRQMTQCVLSWLNGGCNYSAFTGRMYWFCHITSISSFKTTCFHAHLELCKDTPSVQALYHLWSKDSSGECSVNVGGQASSYLIRWSILSGDFPVRSGKPPASWEVKLLNHVQLFLIPINSSLQGSFVHGIFQVRVLEWVTISFSRGYSWPRDQTWVSHIAGRCFTLWATTEAPKKWVAISFSRRSSSPGDRTQISPNGKQILYPLSHQEAQRKGNS